MDGSTAPARRKCRYIICVFVDIVVDVVHINKPSFDMVEIAAHINDSTFDMRGKAVHINVTSCPSS